MKQQIANIMFANKNCLIDERDCLPHTPQSEESISDYTQYSTHNRYVHEDDCSWFIFLFEH